MTSRFPIAVATMLLVGANVTKEPTIVCSEVEGTWVLSGIDWQGIIGPANYECIIDFHGDRWTLHAGTQFEAGSFSLGSQNSQKTIIWSKYTDDCVTKDSSAYSLERDILRVGELRAGVSGKVISDRDSLVFVYKRNRN